MNIPPPPPLHLAGRTRAAGMSYSTVIADFDFETYSEAGYTWNILKNRWEKLPGANKKGLTQVGAARYAEHPSTEILSLAYDLKDGRGARLWKPGDADPGDLLQHIVDGKLLEAFNVGFEAWIWEHICVKRFGWPELPLIQLRCAMAKCRHFSLPGKLANAGAVLKIANPKDKEGTRLLTKFSIPRKPTKANAATRIFPINDPIDAEKLYAYNVRDIVAEAQVSFCAPDLSPFELQLWLVDQRINRRGVRIDLFTINNCILVLQAAYEKYTAEIPALTNGVVMKATQVQKMVNWLNSRGVHTANLQAETVDELLMLDTLHPDVRRVLEVRALIASASVKKIYAMANMICVDGRLHDLFMYYAAHTGRWTGAGPQPQNLPKAAPKILSCINCNHYYGDKLTACPWCGSCLKGKPVSWNPTATEEAIGVINAGSLELVEMFYGSALLTISGCLRSMFIAADGHDLLCADYNSIEAIVLAMIAGEQWRIDVFRTHGKIYEMSASKITGTTFEEYHEYKRLTGDHHPDRHIGKTAELASGYGGWVGAWLKFGADKHFSEEEMKQAILAWRAASPAIVELWGGQKRRYNQEYYGLEGCAVQAVLNPGVTYGYRNIDFYFSRNILFCKLPSGRYLTYHNAELRSSDRRPGTLELSYERWNTNALKGKPGWTRVYTYGGMLTENLVQAVARDIMAHAIVQLEAAGYPIVMHVHDEIVCEVPEGFGSVAELEKIMVTLPEWCKDWPIKASGGWRAKRYKKG